MVLNGRTTTAGAVLVGVVLAGCTSAATGPLGEGCAQASEPQEAGVQGTFEEANLVAAGEVFRLYGTEAAPVRVRATGEVVELAEVPVWLVETEFEVTVGTERRVDAWTFWVGFEDEQLLVLCAEGPDDVTWPPAERS